MIDGFRGIHGRGVIGILIKVDTFEVEACLRRIVCSIAGILVSAEVEKIKFSTCGATYTAWGNEAEISNIVFARFR